MGCDIHIYTERKDKTTGVWECQDYYSINNYYEKYPDEEQPYVREDFYRGRNYELFTALAGVRGKGVESLTPKGFPEDASKECSEDFIRWSTDAHTPSHLTLKEIYEHKDRIGGTVKRNGMISPKQAEELGEGIKPDSWCLWTNQEGYVLAEWEDEYNPMDNFLEQLEAFLQVRYRDFERPDKDSEEFRVVFWFDN